AQRHRREGLRAGVLVDRQRFRRTPPRLLNPPGVGVEERAGEEREPGSRLPHLWRSPAHLLLEGRARLLEVSRPAGEWNHRCRKPGEEDLLPPLGGESMA